MRCLRCASQLTRVLGEAHPNTLVCGMNLGNALVNQAKFDEAERVYRANLEHKRRRLGPEPVCPPAVACPRAMSGVAGPCR